MEKLIAAVPAAISAGTIWGKVWPILIAIVFFGMLIFFHELGHFTFAKIFGVKVNEFSMGMGPCLLKKKKGETQYSLRLFPIGGYVSMEGENESSEDTRAFCNQKAWKRFIIIAAGATVNLIMGMIIIMIMLGTTDELIGTTEIHSFFDGAVTCDQGLEVHDKILKIDNKHVFTGDDMSFLMTRDEDGVFDITVKRDGKKVLVKGVAFNTEKREYDGKETNVIIYDFSIKGLEPSVLSVLKYTPLETLSYARLVYLSLFDLITGHYGISDLSGPIGTVSYIADAAQIAVKDTDWEYLFMLSALIAVNIGIFNLLPLPALDGGHLLFILIEIIFRKPVPRKLEGLVHAIGMILLLALMAVISFSDIWKLIKG
ncbi:MAG: site-2 protease family protein [Clostridia bacterium]|nr:site-2 protease family protein [Clostridia bacterium]